MFNFFHILLTIRFLMLYFFFFLVVLTIFNCFRYDLIIVSLFLFFIFKNKKNKLSFFCSCEPLADPFSGVFLCWFSVRLPYVQE